jgi:hypothetical protein
MVFMDGTADSEFLSLTPRYHNRVLDAEMDAGIT